MSEYEAVQAVIESQLRADGRLEDGMILTDWIVIVAGQELAEHGEGQHVHHMVATIYRPEQSPQATEGLLNLGHRLVSPGPVYAAD